MLKRLLGLSLLLSCLNGPVFAGLMLATSSLLYPGSVPGTQHSDSVAIFDLNTLNPTGTYYNLVVTLAAADPARINQAFPIHPSHAYMVLLNGADVVCNFTLSKSGSLEMVANVPRLSQTVMCTANGNEMDIVFLPPPRPIQVNGQGHQIKS